jgi:hypothetical protein
MYHGLDELTWFDGLAQLNPGKPVNYFFLFSYQTFMTRIPGFTGQPGLKG